MAGTKTTALAALTTIADGDVVPVVDVSDTTQAPSGSTKKTTAATIAGYTVTKTETPIADVFDDTDGTTLLTPRRIAVRDEKYDVRRSGAVGDGVTDDAAAINDAITTVSTALGGTVFFPITSMHYKINSPIVPKSNVHLEGLGGRYVGRTRIRANASALMLADAAVTNVDLRGLALYSDAGGHIIDMAGFGINMWNIDECSFIVQGTNTASAMHTGGGDAIELHVIRCYTFMPTTTTVPAFNMVSNLNAINVCSWTKSRFENSGDYCIHIETASTGFCQDILIADIDFQQCLGGEVRLRSCRSVSLERLSGYDASTYTKDRVRIEKSTTGTASAAIRCVQVVRRNPGALAAGIRDIRLVSAQANSITFDRCNGSIDLDNTTANIIVGEDSTSPAASFLNVYEGTIRMNAGHTTTRRLILAGTAGEGFLQGTEQSADPAAPAANGWVLYAKDNGAGKTQLYVRFATGAAVAIPGAIEP